MKDDEGFAQLLAEIESGREPLKAIRVVIRRIDSVSGDFEHAHELEDRLHHAVLRAIAHGKMAPGESRVAAGLALTSLDLDFQRACA